MHGIRYVLATSRGGRGCSFLSSCTPLRVRISFCTGEIILLCWGETFCTTEITSVLGRDFFYYRDHFCTGERICVLRRSFSVLGRDFVYYGDHFLYYGDHFLYWVETFCTTEITFCTGERVCVLRRSLSVLGRDFLHRGETLCPMEITKPKL